MRNTSKNLIKQTYFHKLCQFQFIGMIALNFALLLVSAEYQELFDWISAFSLISIVITLAIGRFLLKLNFDLKAMNLTFKQRLPEYLPFVYCLVIVGCKYCGFIDAPIMFDASAAPLILSGYLLVISKKNLVNARQQKLEV